MLPWWFIYVYYLTFVCRKYSRIVQQRKMCELEASHSAVQLCHRIGAIVNWMMHTLRSVITVDLSKWSLMMISGRVVRRNNLLYQCQGVSLVTYLMGCPVLPNGILKTSLLLFPILHQLNSSGLRSPKPGIPTQAITLPLLCILRT